MKITDKEQLRRPRTVEEWNALAEAMRAEMEARKPKAAKAPARVAAKDLPLHVVKRPAKGKFKIKSYFMTLLWKKRGCRVEERFTCLCCGKGVTSGWRYVVDGSRVYLCDRCKEVVKLPFVRMIYTPMR